MSINVKLDDPQAFDIAVHGGDGVRTLKDGGDLTVITKRDATVSGRPGAVLTFSVEVDGEVCRAQTVVTLRELHALHAALRGRYGEWG